MAPLLEQDIEALETLDELRTRSADLTTDAAEAIVQWVRDAADRKAKADENWYSARDDVERAMVLRALNLILHESRLSLTKDDLANVDKAREEIRKRLLCTTIESLYEERRHDRKASTGSNSDSGSGSTITDDEDIDEIPAFRACQIFQALAEDDNDASGPFCEASLNCLYRILAEIYRADGPEWKVGGVRASRGAPQSSFVTREGVRSILLIHTILMNTAELLAELQDAKKECLLAKNAPQAWKTQSADLRRDHFKISLSARWPHLLDRQMFKDDPKGSKSEKWTDWAERQVSRQLIRHWKTFGTGRRFFARPNSDEVSPEVHDKVQTRVSEIFEKLAGRHPNLNSVGEAMKTAADRVRRMSEPSKSYLEGVLVAELSSEPGRSSVDPDAAQAAFAAAALAEIDLASGYLDRDDLRLLAATRLASTKLSERNALPIGTPFDVSGTGYRLHPQGAETIRAICDMLRLSNANCEPETARRLVRYFLETRADLPESKRGWHMDVGTTDGKAAVSATTLAFFALADLRAMLDQQINQHILRNFTVRSPQQLKLDLHQLFLPDAASAHKFPTESVGSQLQAMRAHVTGTTSAEKTFSLVLYGPPGTGKTTLIEALACSSAATLVEITPSDILIGGSEEVERHTRLVFSALSMLTQCVILFDEFDSILRQRVRGATLNQFQFLTPGLLPKLKQLHDRAANQRLAYALATNFVVDLDRAAIRTGRFDQKLGVFPPDLLSRVGRLAVEMEKYYAVNDIPDEERTDQHARRAIEIVNSSAGFGMATLGKTGWFTAPLPPAELKNGTPFGRIFNRRFAKPQFGAPEGQIGLIPDSEDNPLGIREWETWSALIRLDESGAAIEADTWGSYVEEVSKAVSQWKPEVQKTISEQAGTGELPPKAPNDVNTWRVVAVLDVAQVPLATDP